MAKILFTTYIDPTAPTIQSLILAAKKYGLDIDIIHIKQTPLTVRNAKPIPQNVEFAIHRDFDITPTQDYYVKQLPATTRQLNKEFLVKFTRYNKIIQYIYLSENHNLPLIPTMWNHVSLPYDLIKDYFQQNVFLAKPVTGSFGKGISLITSQADLDTYYTLTEPKNIIFQKYIPIEWDLRVLIIGDTVIGAMKRVKHSTEAIVTNISSGGLGSRYSLSPEIADLALTAAKSLSLEFAGVDILFDSNNNPYIIEINANPQFTGFNQALQMSVQNLLIEYLVNTQ